MARGAGAARRASGDLAVVALLPEGVLVAGIDGLGHGAEAARAARGPPTSCASSPSADLVLLVERCHAALRGTRGAAISLAFVSPPTSGMTWLGVGNVEGRVLERRPVGDPARRARSRCARGVPGHELPPVRPATLAIGRATSSCWPPTASSAPSPTRPMSPARPQDDQRAHPRAALEAPGRCPGRGRPLPRRAAVSTGASTGTGPFRAAYASALRDYLRDPTEISLRAAYELAREAVGRQLSVLDLAVAHQEALSRRAGTAPRARGGRAHRTRGRRLLPRGPVDVRDGPAGLPGGPPGGPATNAARPSSRASSRRFLADASLALDAHDSLQEMLQLVAEQARELVGADCCVATVAAPGLPRSAEAASYAEGDRRWRRSSGGSTCEAIYRLVRRSGGSIRVAGEQLADLPPFRDVARRARRFRAGWRRR